MTSFLFGGIGGSSNNKDLEQLPEPPTLDQIVSDLDASGADDIVFNADVSALLNDEHHPTSGPLLPKQIPKRFDNQAESTLYEKVIHHKQNVKRVSDLKGELPELEEGLCQLREELQEDRKRVENELRKAIQLQAKVENDNRGDEETSDNNKEEYEEQLL